jgi:threonine synthase
MLSVSELDLQQCIDSKWDRETSVVLRYRNAFTFGATEEEDSRFKALLGETSIKEGARIFPLLSYRGVEIHLLDETSLMRTKTLKSIDGCVSIAKCKLKGYEKVVFESGGNTGTALTEYGVRAGLETFFFVPEENISLLNGRTFSAKNAHLISVKSPGMVKPAAESFSEFYGLKHIPETSWRYDASRFRGMFILEHILEHGSFDWMVQTISAAFGPIGIYWALGKFGTQLRSLPRFLGIQQEANCPMYRAWKSGSKTITPIALESTAQLLTKVMYDFKPHTYGTYQDFVQVLQATRGDLTTLNQREFGSFVERKFDGENILDLLRKHGIEITLRVEEKTGLMAIAGALKEIDKGTIAKGARILCCLTSGVTESEGTAQPEFRIESLKGMLEDYEAKFSRRNGHG